MTDRKYGGPAGWKLLGSGEIIDANGYSVCTVTRNKHYEVRAPLIASAPDLLKACEWVVEWLGDVESEDSPLANKQFIKALKSCRAAISKSREGSNG